MLSGAGGRQEGWAGLGVRQWRTFINDRVRACHVGVCTRGVNFGQRSLDSHGNRLSDVPWGWRGWLFIRLDRHAVSALARSRDGGDLRLVAFVRWYGMVPGLLCCEGLVVSF